MPAERPKAARETSNNPQDDGLFGPASVTWRVLAAPSAGLGILCAVNLQTLLPRVIRLLEQSSSVRRNPEERSRRTQEYGMTTTYGDVEAAETAGATLRRIHAHATAIDLETGQKYAADEPDLLLWVHATIVWGLVRALDRWGPRLTPAERDRFVDEQRIAARLVGLDPETVPRTWLEMDTYMQSMQPKLAYTMQALTMETFALSLSRPLSPGWIIGGIARLGADSLLTPDQRAVQRIRWTVAHDVLAQALVRGLLFLGHRDVPYTDLLSTIRADAMEHAFGRKKTGLTPATPRPRVEEEPLAKSTEAR